MTIEDKELKELVDSGLTYEVIGEKIGRTRNAVAGLINRAKQRGVKFDRREIPRGIEGPPSPLTAVNPDNSCRAIMDDGKYCPLVPVRGQYCAEHHDLFHKKPDPVKSVFMPRRFR